MRYFAVGLTSASLASRALPKRACLRAYVFMRSCGHGLAYTRPHMFRPRTNERTNEQTNERTAERIAEAVSRPAGHVATRSPVSLLPFRRLLRVFQAPLSSSPHALVPSGTAERGMPVGVCARVCVPPVCSGKHTVPLCVWVVMHWCTSDWNVLLPWEGGRTCTY